MEGEGEGEGDTERLDKSPKSQKKHPLKTDSPSKYLIIIFNLINLLRELNG